MNLHFVNEVRMKGKCIYTCPRRIALAFVLMVICLYCIRENLYTSQAGFSPGSSSYKESVKGVQSITTKQLIILTYARSGSSWLGNLFNYNPSAFYYFEPLWAVEWLLKYNLFPDSSHKTGVVPSPLQEIPKLKEILADFLNCRFSEIPISVLAPVPPYHKWFTVDDRHHHLGSFKACILNRTDDRPCRPLLTRACRNASIVAFKTIRMTLRMAEDILDKNPDLRILHLVRDPRGAMWSKFNAFLRGQNSWENTVAAFKKTTDEYCKNLTDNINARFDLEERFPGRIIDIRYEDIVKNPLREAVKLYQFLGQPIPEVVKEWVINSTTARYDNGLYGTSRSRPLHTAYQWIHTMDRWALETVEEACSHGMQHFRYIPFVNLTEKFDELLSHLE